MRKTLKKLSLLMMVVLVVTLLPIQVLPVRADDEQTQVSSDVYSTIDEAVEYVREQMIARVESITVRISKKSVSDVSNTVLGFMDKVFEYKRGGSGQAGDALAKSTGTWSCQYSVNSDAITMNLHIRYFTTAQQEEQLTEAVNNALEGLNLEGKTTYEKIRSIYDFICDNVDYDYDGLNDRNNTIKYTAYSALINGKAVCQGYAVLFYRMCIDAGIPTRIISGIGNGGAHAWNIVEINGYYYNVDVTWDGQESITRHDYFLKNMANFSDHERNEEYSTNEFNAAFPMSEDSYIDYNSLDASLNAQNYDYTFTTIDGTRVSTSASGKPKLLVFFSNDITSGNIISSIANADFSDTDIICINISPTGDTEKTENFRNNYGNDSMQFCAYSADNRAAEYDYISGMGSVHIPIIAYIDSYNNIQMVSDNNDDAEIIRIYVDYYCKGIKNEPKHNHIYSDVWSMNEEIHWRVCLAEGCDGSIGNKAEHIAGDWIVDKEATVNAEGSRHKECTVCGYVMETESIDKLEPIHIHSYSSEWTYDRTNHWHKCTADGCDGTVKDKAEHIAGDWIVDKEATVNAEGSRHKECTVCGYVMETESIDKLVPQIDMDADTSKYYNVTTNGGSWDGTHYYLPSGQMVRNSFFSEGTYTYYLQADGTPMKDRLTYHPDGVHVIYFDADGHEVFSDFAHISKSIAGADVDDMCFFNVYGYMYVDTLTYDKTGTKLYYVNPYGVLERNGWFQFSGHEFDAGLGFSGKAGGYGYANSDCSLIVNTNIYDWNGNFVYMQGDGHMAR